MNTNHDDHQRKDANEEVLAGLNDSSYRTTFRSNILKRIYEKNSRLPSDVIENVLVRENDNETKDFSNEEQRLKSLKLVPLSNEWRKTLERILNCDQGYLDGQLEVSRKDALCFFIQKEWPTESENKSPRGKKKSKKSPSPDREVSRVLVKRSPAISWKEMVDDNPMKLSSVLGDKLKDQEAIDAINGYILQNNSSLYERYILHPLQSLDYLYSLNFLFRRNESSKAFKFFSWLYDLFVQYGSKKNKIIKSPQSSQMLHQQNNNRFRLEVTLAEISFSKHYLMNEECKLLRLLNVSYEQYQKSISHRTSHQLARVNEVIAAIETKVETTSKNIDKAEHEFNIDLLWRLVDFQRAIINTRRKSLIELLRIWDRVMSHKTTSKLVTNNRLNLKLEEAAHIDEDKERMRWNRLVEQSARWEELIQDKSKVNRENVESVTFLYDGRLPGEPKFSNIELVYDRLKDDKNHLDVLYTIQISIGEKTFVQFEPLYLESDFFNLKWNQSVSIALPWFPNAQHTLNTSSLEEHCRQYLPTIAIYEKHGRKGVKARQEPRLIWQQTLEDLPRFYQKSANNAKLFETNFEFAFKEEENDNRLRIKGSLQLCTFWASLPFDAKTIADSSTAEIIFDKEKRQIKQMTDLKVIDQTLHDLRYLDAINLDIFVVDNSTSGDSMRQIQLMDLCLRQKYQIELNNNLLQKEEITRKHKFVINKMEQPKNLDPGTFCSDEEIEQNKRFQLMIYRNSGANQNYRHLRFIPLGNVTDVMLQNVILTEKTENLSIEILLDYVRMSCEEQEKRILCLNKKRVKKKNAENGSQIFHDWCLTTFARGSTNRLLMSSQNWVQIVGQVLDKIELDRQSPNGHSGNSDGFVSKKRLGNFTLDDIIREEPIESLDGTKFSLFLPFANMNRSKLNPNRKDRRKVAITISEALDREVQVVLSVQHALNVPLRTSTRTQSKEVHEEDDEDDEERFTPCASFVEILYDNQNISTSIADGPQPTWNENFRFKIKLDPRKYITLNLFEVLKSSNLSPEPSAAKTIHSTTKQALDSNDETAAHELNEANTHLQLEKRYFGQFKIPIFSILFNSKIEGTFSLSSPYFLQNYKSISTSASKSTKRSKLKIMESSEEDDIRSTVDAKLLSTVNLMQSLYSDDVEQTLLGSLPDIALSLFITIDPPIEPVLGFHSFQKNASVESADLVELCNRWRTQLSTQFHNRHYICLVETIQHKLVLACRYLSPIKPPDLNELIQLDQIVLSKGKSKAEGNVKRTKVSMKNLVNREAIYLNMIIRFVSLMPTFSSNPPSGNLIDQSWWWRLSKSGTFWLDAAQFLSFRIGFQVEHAVYLCCMLQFLNRNAYLLYGTSLLEGPTGYVLLYPTSTSLPSSKEDNANEYEPIVINPKTGQQFSVRDYNITILSIDCIVTNDNIYANVQKNAHPNSMQYNLRKNSHWQPLFSSTKEIVRLASFEGHKRAEFISIQPEKIDYSNSINHDSVSGLESRLENFLRDQLMNWRRQQAGTFTLFNRYCTQIVRRILPQLESHACLASSTGSVYSQQQQVRTLEEALLHEMEEINAVHSIVGYPLHVSPLIEFEQIAQLVHSTDVHSLDVTFSRENGSGLRSNAIMIEFVVSVYVHAYPANVYSIWVYVGALVPKA